MPRHLGCHAFQPTGTIFKLIQHIIGTNLLTIFHEDRTINVTSRQYIYSHIRKNAPPPGGHVFKATGTIFELVQDIIGTNLQTKFHDDWNINVASRVLTRKNAPPPGGNVFQPTGIIRPRNYSDKSSDQVSLGLDNKLWPLEKNDPPLGSHVFQANVTIFKLIQDIIETNLLTKFHEDWTINVASKVLTRKNAPTPGGHFHEDRTLNVASRVHIWKNAPPLGSHVFQANITRASL
ncbi:hypothetical protein DPMN_116548 [Dreissena polymorpha]|uniref:Uncharacterized protein n=1 Tax=Dreissena polymorpha TaxID=45954 RepID=A0A9D4KQ17_DREPO|nr:hypothetical protein DPMN_116548 [Dreissena polymorpha]